MTDTFDYPGRGLWTLEAHIADAVADAPPSPLELDGRIVALTARLMMMQEVEHATRTTLEYRIRRLEQL